MTLPRTRRILLTGSFAGIPRVRRLAKALADAGYMVTVLEWDREDRLPEKEVVNGILFIRYRRKAGFGVRAALGMVGWFIHQLVHVLTHSYEIIQPRNLDSLLPVMIALILSRKREKVRLVYDMSDFYADSYLNVPVIRTLIGMLERALIERVDALLVVSPKQLLQLGRRPGTRVVAVYNYPSESDVRYDGNRGYDLFYAGSMGRDRCWELINLVKLSITANMTLGIAGFGECEEVIRRIADELEGVHFLGRLSREELLRVAASSRFMAIPHHPRSSPNYVVALPNKFLDAVELGKPVIAVKGTYVGELVERYRLGVVVDLEHPAESARTLRGGVEDRGGEGFASLREMFGWEGSKRRYLALIESLMRR